MDNVRDEKHHPLSERKSENSIRTGKLLKKCFLAFVKESFVYEYVGFFLSKGEKLIIPEISHNRMTGLPVEGFNVP